MTFADFFACPDIQKMVARSDSSLDFVRDRQFLQDGPSVITQSAIDNTPRECRQHQHLLHRILTTTTAPRCQVAQQTCHLHINHNECCRRYAACDFWLRRCYYYWNRNGELISGNFHSSETYRAMTKMERGKEILGGCVLRLGSRFRLKRFLEGGGPFVLTQLTSSPFVLYIFFLA